VYITILYVSFQNENSIIEWAVKIDTSVKHLL